MYLVVIMTMSARNESTFTHVHNMYVHMIFSFYEDNMNNLRFRSEYFLRESLLIELTVRI